MPFSGKCAHFLAFSGKCVYFMQIEENVHIFMKMCENAHISKDPCPPGLFSGSFLDTSSDNNYLLPEVECCK